MNNLRDFLTALAIGAIAALAAGSAAIYAADKVRKENPFPQCVEGFMIVKVCASQATNAFPSWMLVDPNSVSIIANDVNSPNNCVKIIALGGRGFFVYGTEISIAQERERAKVAKCGN